MTVAVIHTLRSVSGNSVWKTMCFLCVSIKHMKYLLKERYGENIMFAKVSGRKNVVCFKDLCRVIVTDKWYSDRAADNSSPSVRIVKDAARLIASEIREMKYSMDVYPSSD